MNAPLYRFEYVRINEDTAHLCKRQDFPRAINVLQRRDPDHRRWRRALRGIAHTAAGALDGRRRGWVSSAVRELVGEVDGAWLRSELVVDLQELAPGFAPEGLLPQWTARDLWRLADTVGMPMEYVAHVTPLPGRIDDPVDTARVVIDCRRTARAHREVALQLAGTLDNRSLAEAMPLDQMVVRVQIDGQRNAAERWRALGKRLLLGAGAS